MQLDQILNSGTENEQVESEVVDESHGEQSQGDSTSTSAGAPTAHETIKHVPLAALEAERTQRQDWKEKAIRFEEELKALRNAQQQPANQYAPQQQLDPLQSIQQQIINERFNTSEMLVRNQHQDADEKVNVFMEAAKANPALAAALQQQRHPWQFAYTEGKRILMQREIGDDPAAYKEKLKAEWLAELQANQSSAPQKQAIPTSLNGARSVAPRSANAWTGPTPLDSIVKRH